MKTVFGANALKNLISSDAIKYAFISLPAVIYFIFVSRYAVNVPAWDDYLAILKFLCSYHNARGIERLNLLLAPHNEHRIVVSRVVYLLYYNITGGINFRSLIFIANIQLALTFVIFVSFVKKALPASWVLVSFVLGLCLFDLNNWQNADFAMAGMANYGVIFFFAASLYFYNLPKKWHLVVAVLLQICCTYSSGNGMIGSAVLMLYNLLAGKRISTIASGCAFAIFSPLYFVGYISPPRDPLPGASTMLVYFFHFMGAFLDEGLARLPVIIGIVLFITLAATLPINKKLRIKDGVLPLVCVFGFIVISVLPIAVFRSNAEVIPSRYKIYSNLLMVFLLIFTLLKNSGERTKKIIAACYTITILAFYCRDMKLGAKDFEHLSFLLKNVDYFLPEKDDARKITDQSCQLHIYCIEDKRQPKIIF